MNSYQSFIEICLVIINPLVLLIFHRFLLPQKVFVLIPAIIFSVIAILFPQNELVNILYHSLYGCIYAYLAVLGIVGVIFALLHGFLFTLLVFSGWVLLVATAILNFQQVIFS